MNAVDHNEPERGGDDILAAEYVLGVLPADERRVAGQRVESDPAFARLVDRWELDLSPMAAAYQPVEPPARLKAAIDARIFSARTSEPSRLSLWANIAFWRGLAAAAIAGLAIYIAVPYVNSPVETPQVRLVASLAADGSDVRYLAVYDGAHGDVALSHVSGDRASGHDFELWMIEGGNAPVSMGVIPIGSNTHLVISPEARQKLASGAVLAVSLEPKGGSPTGKPTGPVVAAGDLKTI